VLKWKSFTPLTETIIETSLKSAITRLFIQLENKHGASLVKYLLSKKLNLLKNILKTVRFNFQVT
jgi:hypothetical protein